MMDVAVYSESNENLLQSNVLISERPDPKFSIFIADGDSRIGSIDFTFINDNYECEEKISEEPSRVYDITYINFDEKNSKFTKEKTLIFKNNNQVINTLGEYQIDIIVRYKIVGTREQNKILYYNIYRRNNKLKDADVRTMFKMLKERFILDKK